MRNGLLKKTAEDRLPHGRGSGSTYKHAVTSLSRAREQASFAFFSSLSERQCGVAAGHATERHYTLAYGTTIGSN